MDNFEEIKKSFEETTKNLNARLEAAIGMIPKTAPKGVEINGVKIIARQLQDSRILLEFESGEVATNFYNNLK